MSDAFSSAASASSASARVSLDRTDSLLLAPVDVPEGVTSVEEELTSVRPGASFRAKSGEISMVTDSVRCIGDPDDDSNEAA